MPKRECTASNSARWWRVIAILQPRHKQPRQAEPFLRGKTLRLYFIVTGAATTCQAAGAIRHSCKRASWPARQPARRG
jgi:hypothetical protein